MTAGADLGRLLRAAGLSRPGAPAVLAGSDGSVLMTYADLDARSAALAAALVSAGVRPGDRVAVRVRTSPDAVALHLACVRSGAVHLPLNPAATKDELAHVLADARPSVVVHDPVLPVDLPGAWAALSLGTDGTGTLVARAGTDRFEDVPRDGSDPAALLYTSGTTGRPKGALLSHANLVHNARTLADAWGFTGDDTVLHVLPLHHTHGLFVALHCALVAGAATRLHDRFDPVAAAAAMPEVTVFMGVPTHYVRLLAEPDFDRTRAGGLRLMTSGSAPMGEATHAAVRERTGQTVLERYGMTETSILTSNPLLGERRPGTVGRPLPGVEVRVVDATGAAVAVGEPGAVQVRGPNVFAGYWDRPDLLGTEFTGDGWFRTGDLGTWSDDGYLTLVGRSKDLVISGGLNVYPKEVEAVLDLLPGVAESAVVGVPDEDLGEAVVAAVVADEGACPAPDELRALARERLAGYKVPRRVVVVDELPRNAMGKVEKTRLRALLTADDRP